MLISSKWLTQYIPEFNPDSITSIKQRIDTRLSEVESINKVGQGLSGLVIAQITATVPHPTNTKLVVCTVNDGTSELKTVVCGAPNAAVGLKTVYCKKGGTVLDANKKIVQIDERQMGEITSVGMLCAPNEIGMGNDHSQIVSLPEESVIGESVLELLQDTIIEIENKALPHRPDAFSHLGIARELSAIFKLELLNKEYAKDLIATSEDKVELSIDIQDTKSCTRFSAIVIKGVKVSPSPLWLQSLLQHCGVKPVNNIVDITNYVMLSIGQPLHAFDLNRTGNKLVVRMSKSNEQVVTLDHKNRVLETPMTVISGNNGIESIAGIMGGEHGEITNVTTDIVIEAAGWEMYQIRRASRNLGLRSEASLRYEKGITNEYCTQAVVMAAGLILDLAGGDVASNLYDQVITPNLKKVIEFDLADVKKLSGADIDKKQIIEILESLQFKVGEQEKLYADSLSMPGSVAMVTVEVPAHRKDISLTQDIVEEVVRMYGYENIIQTVPKRDLATPAVNQFLNLKRKISQSLISLGSTEVMTYSMVSKQMYSDFNLQNQHLTPILEPISPELSFLRSLITPSLLSKIKQNSTKYYDFSLHEISKVVTSQTTEEKLPLQPDNLGVVVTKSSNDLAVSQVMQLFNNLNSMYFKSLLYLQPGTNLMLHPGISADVYIQGTNVGFIGLVHPTINQNISLTDLGVGLLEINLTKIWQFVSTAKTKSTTIVPSNLQAATRDITVIQKVGVTAQDLIQNIYAKQIEYLESVSVVDHYQGKNEVSFTLRLIIQPLQENLNSDQINEVLKQVNQVILSTGLNIKL